MSNKFNHYKTKTLTFLLLSVLGTFFIKENVMLELGVIGTGKVIASVG